MTREHAKELIPIIAAYAEGETIQYLKKGDTVWRGMNEEGAFCHTSPDIVQYRIAPAPDPDPDPYAELKAAHAAGKVIQLLLGYDWQDHDRPDWTALPEAYRIKPAPKLVPLTSDDLPPVVWVKDEGDERMSLLTSFHEDGCIDVNGAIYDEEDQKLILWSPDRKTWHSFMKEVEG